MIKMTDNRLRISIYMLMLVPVVGLYSLRFNTGKAVDKELFAVCVLTMVVTVVVFISTWGSLWTASQRCVTGYIVRNEAERDELAGDLDVGDHVVVHQVGVTKVYIHLGDGFFSELYPDELRKMKEG